MKHCKGTLIAFTMMFVATLSGNIPCRQSMEIRSNGHVLVEEKQCNQLVEQAQLQKEPEIFYHHFLETMEHRYTLFFLEKNKDSKSYTIHWLITDIIPMNSSLTANKTTHIGYVPPNNENISTYSVLLYKHPLSFNLSSSSNPEINNFIDKEWVESLANVRLENNRTFFVTGRNTSQTYQTSSTGYQSSSYTHFPSRPYVPVQPQSPVTPPPSILTPPVTTQQQYFTPSVTDRPAYHFYNTTNATNNTSTHQHPTSIHSQKSGASNNIVGINTIILLLISILMKEFFY